MELSEQQKRIEEATFEYTMGDVEVAERLLRGVIAENPQSAAALHALAEVMFSIGRLDAALEAGLAALEWAEEDVHLHTSLSRIYMEKGDKDTAEKHGARARVLGWREVLKGADAAG